MVRGGSIIMPGVASKALEMFARMAHGQACISIDDKQTEELQDNEWKIIREVGCGLSNKEIAGWAADAVLWANQNHIINGRKSGNTNLLCPKDSATRAECATMLKQYFEKTK